MHGTPIKVGCLYGHSGSEAWHGVTGGTILKNDVDAGGLLKAYGECIFT